VAQVLGAGLFELLPSAVRGIQCLESFHFARRRIVAVMHDERVMKCTNQRIRRRAAALVPFVILLLALPFDFTHQLEQHLGQIIEHLSSRLAKQRE
jgi:hypothetical protein